MIISIREKRFCWSI